MDKKRLAQNQDLKRFETVRDDKVATPTLAIERADSFSSMENLDQFDDHTVVLSASRPREGADNTRN